MAPIDAAGKRVVEIARSLVPKQREWVPTDGIARAVQKAFSANHPAPVHIRVAVPVTDASRLLATVASLLQWRRYARIPSPAGIDSLYARRERAVAVSVGPQVVVVDVLVFEGVVPSPRMVADAASRTWESLLTPTSQSGLPTDGHAVRWKYSPAAVADLGFLEPLSREQDRISIERIAHPDTGMSGTALLASRIYSFSGAEPRRFQEVETTIDLDGGRLAVGSVTELAGELPVKALSSCSPSVSVDFPGALSRFDISTECMRFTDVPGDAMDRGAIDYSEFKRAMVSLDWLGRTEWLGWALAVPWAPFALARVPLGWNAGAGPRAMQRMVRFGWANPSFGASDVFWGLLPVGKGTEAVACAADEEATACKAKSRLKPDGSVHDLGGRFARLVRLGDRLVLLTSKDRKAVEAMKPVLTSASVPAMRGTISAESTRRLMSQLGMESEAVRYSATLLVEGNELVVKAGPSN